MRVVFLNEKEASRNDVPFVVKEIPQSLKAVQSAISGKKADWVRVYLKRIVDYHSPLATGSLKKVEIDLFNNFGMSLYQYWQQAESASVKLACKLQLQEMLSQSLILALKAEKHKFETLFERFTQY